MDAEYHRAYSKRHYQENKEKYKAKAKSQYLRLRLYVQNLKNGKPCMDCGKCYPHYVMDFDHREPTEKLDCVAMMLTNGVSKARLDAEIEKCDLVCSNCHRERTHGHQF